MMTAKKKILLIIVVLALVAGGVFYFFQKYPKITIEPEITIEPKITIEPLEREVPKTFGGKIYEIIKNPAEKIPQTNPFKAEINPFEGLKINPFE